MSNSAPGFAKHPNYEVDIRPLKEEIVVSVKGFEIARSRGALAVSESKHRPVWYIPFADLDDQLLSATTTSTYCPLKGHASYWSVLLPEQALPIEDALWAYQSPYDECTALKNYASFYTNKVDVHIDGQLANKDGPGWTER